MSRGRASGAGTGGGGRVDPLLGQVVAGRYEVVRLLGKGGMGAVYEVRHQRLKRSFAMKTLTAGRADDGEALARFQREADVVATLRHANVVEVIDWEQLPDGAPCMIMELLRGEDLGERLERGPLPWPLLARVADQVLSALAAAHRAGIVHRDLKPQNIFLVEDDSGEVRAKLLDFGVSKIRDSAFKTTDDRLIGTPAYMSPEQANGESERITSAADVWAMGAMLFEMATGRPAFKATSVPALLHRIAFGQPEALLPLRPDAPAGFVTLVARALSREPERRMTTTDELRVGLRAALAGVAPGVLRELGSENDDALLPMMGGGATPQPTTLSQAAGQPSGAQGRPRMSRRRWLGVGGLTTLVAAGVVVVLWQMGERGRGPGPGSAAPEVSAPTGGSTGRPQVTPLSPSGAVVTPLVVADAGAAAVAAPVQVRVEATPVAQVFVAGEPRGKTPLTLEVQPGAAPLRVRLEARGHVARELEVDGQQPVLSLRLEREDKGGRPSQRPSPSPSALASPSPTPSPTPVKSPSPSATPKPSKSPGTVIFDPYAKP